MKSRRESFYSLQGLTGYYSLQDLEMSNEIKEMVDKRWKQYGIKET